jgi:signal transduction histidine kinase
VREAASSLIENALNFTTGRVAVRVFVDNGVPRLQVEDEGPGIPATKLKALLNKPFIQGDSSLTRSVGGLGLSLYIVRQVLEASGGWLDVQTGPDRGSVFTMALPRATH